MVTQLLAPRSSEGSRLASLTSSQPANTVTAAQLGEPFGKDAEWITARTGIESLRRLLPGENLLAYATDAASRALNEAGIPAQGVDLLIVATCSANADPGPSFGTRLAGELGLRAASGASIPIALNNLPPAPRPIAGALALFAGFGAGLSYAAQVVRFP